MSIVACSGTVALWISKSFKMETNSPNVNGWRRFVVGRNPRWTVIRAGILAVACFVVFGFILKPLRVEGPSMLPSYRNGSVKLLNRLAYHSSAPKRGDVVCIRTTGLHHLYMKRVVGLPGERIEIFKGLVLINGGPLGEPYVVQRADWNLAEKQIGQDKYVVIGDNRQMDQRWHSWGEVSREKIVGKVLW